MKYSGKMLQIYLYFMHKTYSSRFQIGPFSKVGTVLTLKENNHDCLFILFLMFENVKYYLELKNNLEI